MIYQIKSNRQHSLTNKFAFTCEFFFHIFEILIIFSSFSLSKMGTKSFCLHVTFKLTTNKEILVKMVKVVLICRYAIGGFDGATMVSSVEIYDPRTGTWIAGEPMKDLRGYLATAVVKESIYVIGGYKGEQEDFLDTVRLILELEMTQICIYKLPLT